MITRWKLANFKTVRQEAALTLRPLTILAGANSSGKSTLLQSMLLVTQTLCSRQYARPLLLNGPLTRLGQFDDLRCEGGESPTVSIKWEVQFSPDADVPAATVGCQLALDAGDSGQPRLKWFRMHATGDFERGRRGDHFLEVNVQSDGALSIDMDQPSLEKLRREYPGARLMGAHLRFFLAAKLSVEFNAAEKETRLLTALLFEDRASWLNLLNIHESVLQLRLPGTVVSCILKHAKGSPLEPDVRKLLTGGQRLPPVHPTIGEWQDGLQALAAAQRQKVRHLLREVQDDLLYLLRQSTVPRTERADVALPPELALAVHLITDFFESSVKYLGPLRDDPKAIYPITPSADPSDIGLRGEYTAAVLNGARSAQVHYLPSACFTTGTIDLRPSTATLEEAVVDWLQYLGVAAGIQTEERGKLGHELRVRTAPGERWNDLTHVGVGVSQVLPILVLCLSAKPGSTLIFEQPELHLHPAVQALLGDFFLAMALDGRQCVLETHSEHIINRMRWRVASSESDLVLRTLGIYFVERSEGAARFNEVEINSFGAISRWPEGFFDQSQREVERILRAAHGKGRKKD